MAMSSHKIIVATVLAMLCACLELTSSQITSRAVNWSEGGEYTLECQLNGAADATQVTWTYPAQEDRVTTVPAGSVSRLTVRNARIEDAGDYECRHTSAVIVRYTVSVSGIPAFVANQITAFPVYEGGDLVLPCQVRHCSGTNCFVHWKRNTHSVDLATSTQGVITTKSLTLRNVQQANSGSYICSISRPFRELEFTVSVIPANERVPMLNKSIDNQYKEFDYNQALVLTCPLRSGENSTENPITVAWVFTNVHDQPQFVYGTVLTLEPEFYNRGEYKCTASNSFGLDSLDIFVEINAPPLPAFVTLPAITLTEGSPSETLEFTAPTSPVALSSLRYQWDRQNNNDDEDWTPVQYSSKYSLNPSGHLMINTITLLDAGLYRVTISNAFGSSIQTRQVSISTRPTPGMPVEIGFTFTLPESSSCSHIQESSELLTMHLSAYLDSLCANTTALLDSCSDLAIQDVSVECKSSTRQGAFRGRLRSSSTARQMAQVFEENGPTRLSHDISINPCGEGQCVLPTEAIESLRDLVAVLVAVVMVLVVLVVVTIIIVICMLKHKECTKNCRVSNVENGPERIRNLEQAFETTSTPPNHYTLHTLHTPQYTHDTLGQTDSHSIY